MGQVRLLIGFALFAWLGAGPAAPATLGEPCDGLGGIQCADGLWCEHEAGQCGMDDAAGQCVKAAEVCTQDYEPVCGCDGETYGNQCMAKVAKVQVDYIGECTE
jgi:hypothetical protein